MKNKAVRAFTLAATLIFAPVITPMLSAIACGPDYPRAVLFSYNHPDLPLTLFAAGHLGVIQANWARSYLCVAYRFLSARPLTAEAKDSAVYMWHQRIHDQGGYLFDDDFYSDSSYLSLRREILHLKNQPDYTAFSNLRAESGNWDSSFKQATVTLKLLTRRYGQFSPQVKTWLAGQDEVFGLGKRQKPEVPKSLTVSNCPDKMLRQLRQYQIAAAYLHDYQFGQAEPIFAALSKDKSFPYQNLAFYLTERCRVEISQGAGTNTPVKTVLAEIEKKASSAPSTEVKLDIIGLGGKLLSSTLTADENCKRVINAVAANQNTSRKADYPAGSDLNFGRDLGDLTYYLDLEEKPVSKEVLKDHDLTDFLTTIYSAYSPYEYYSDSPEDKAREEAVRAEKLEHSNHALSQWRKKHSLPWLVAVMLCGGLRAADRQDARAAAEALTINSPAYLTAAFYLNDSLLAEKKFDAVATRLKTLATLAQADMPASTANLFKAQKLVVARDIDSYFQAACMKITAASSNDLLIPDGQTVTFDNRRPTMAEAFDVEVASDLDRNLPFSVWLALSRKHSEASNLRARIISATWLRAVLLDKKQYVPELTKAMINCYPTCAAKLRAFAAATSEKEKSYLFAQIILDNYGLSPYVQAGMPRMGAPHNQFNYYQNNYWLPLEIKEKPQEQAFSGNLAWVADRGNAAVVPLTTAYYKESSVTKILTAAQRQEATIDLKQLLQAHPSKVIGESILNRAASQATKQGDDQNLPQYLYKVLKMPYWSGESSIGHDYSRRAYQTLHRQYPRDKWTKKAVCWY